MKKVMAGLIVLAGVGGTCLAAETNAPATPAPVAKTWVDSITLKGDFRYRNETINDDSKKNSDKQTYTRQRDRIRARLSAEAKCNDNLKAVVGLSTGGNDPISGNQTLGDGGQKKDMKLDLAYLDYSFIGDTTPSEIHGFAGKMKNPFITLNDDLIWDSDLSPEGLAAKSQFGNDIVTVYGNAGYIWLQERDSKDAANLLAGQGAVKFQFIPEAALTLGASYYGFQNLKGYDVIDWEGKNNSYGNTTQKGTISGTTTNKAWASDFTPVVYFASLDLWIAGLPVSIFGQELSNTDASKLDQGHMYGVSIGKAKRVGTFEVGYSYAELEKDATVGMWTDSDRWGGGTDGKGHKLYAKYQIMKNLQLGASYFKDDKGIASGKPTDYDRLQVDLLAAF